MYLEQIHFTDKILTILYGALPSYQVLHVAVGVDK